MSVSAYSPPAHADRRAARRIRSAARRDRRRLSARDTFGAHWVGTPRRSPTATFPTACDLASALHRTGSCRSRARRPSGYPPDAIFAALHRRRRSPRRPRGRNDTRREQPGYDDTNAPRCVANTRDLRVVRHHSDDESAALRHHFRHHTQKARCFRTGPDLQFRWWRGQDLNLRPSGYEPDELPDCSTPRRTMHGTHARASDQVDAQEAGRKLC